MRTQVRNFPKTPDDGWRVYQLKSCINNKQDDKYPSNVNNVHNSSSLKYRTI
uniref:Uncharacterized protein n=1 Tax=Octopus bimaculoides TaxID=37653 RepID=A0A0L8FV75_OCTBM